MAVSANSIAFVIVSCDRYADLWDPFFYFFKRNWPDCPYKVYLITNNMDFKIDDVEIIKVGEDRSYSDNLSVALSYIREPWAILWLEDVFISEKVDTTRIEKMIKEAQSIPVGYLKISSDLPLSYTRGSSNGIGPLPKGVRYRSAVGLSLYQVETLRKLLIPNASAWDLDTSNISDGLSEPFYALTDISARNPPVKFVNAVIKGQWNWPAIPLLKKEGFDHIIAGRKRLSIAAYFYTRAFLLHNLMLRLARKDWY